MFEIVSIIVACLFVWWLFGLLNLVIAYQVWPDDLDHYYNGKGNRILCLAFGPILLVMLIGWGALSLPLKYGCSWGMFLARKLNKFRNS